MIYEMLLLVTALAITPDGPMFASGYTNGMIKFWNLFTGQLLSAFAGHNGVILALAFSSEGRLLIGRSSEIKIWGNP